MRLALPCGALNAPLRTSVSPAPDAQPVAVPPETPELESYVNAPSAPAEQLTGSLYVIVIDAAVATAAVTIFGAAVAVRSKV